MPGQHGSSRVTTQNLRLYQIHEDDSLDLIKGAVPGHNGALVAIKKAIKKR